MTTPKPRPTLEQIRALEKALEPVNPRLADLVGVVAYRMEPDRGGLAVALDEAMACVEEDDAARDCAWTPEEFALARQLLGLGPTEGHEA